MGIYMSDQDGHAIADEAVEPVEPRPAWGRPEATVIEAGSAEIFNPLQIFFAS